jgi:hypothetical protein
MNLRLSILVFAVLMWGAFLPDGVLHARNPVPQTGNASVLEYEAQGEHIRLETEYGPVHVWRPLDYDGRTAGIVVYIHGYFTTLDQTWTEDHLDEQFQASGRNAIFIAPQAPRARYDAVSWKSLEALLETVDEQTPFGLPHGPVVVMGHSGGFRTILYWLHDPRVRDVILLDGLYSGQQEFRYWLRNQEGGNSHRMVLVASMTLRQSNRLARRVPGAVRRSNIPEEFSGFTPQQVRARLLYMHSQYEHEDIISSGKVIPLVLQLAPLKNLSTSQPLPDDRPVRRTSSTGR